MSSPSTSPDSFSAADTPTSNATATSAGIGSWSVPSFDQLVSTTKRASVIPSRYGWLAGATGTTSNAPGASSSPTPSARSVRIEQDSNEVAIVTKARKASSSLATSITTVVNESSLALYRVNEHVHKKIPVLVKDKKALADVQAQVNTANQDLEDAQQILSSLQRLPQLSSIESLLQRALAATKNGM